MIDLRLGNCLDEIKNIADNSIDCIVTSPPYNKGYWSSNRNENNFSFYKTKSRRIEYGEFDDNLSPEEYEEQQRELLKECIRVIKPTGSIFYNHIDILHDHQTIHPKYVYDFPLKQIIIWNRKNTPKLDKSYFFPITEYIYWIQKTTDARAKFNRENCIYKSNVWEIMPDRDNDFPAPFPLDLPINCIKATTDENDLVLDPYLGSGTTGLACKKLKRNFIGFKLNADFLQKAQNRINGVEELTEDKKVQSKLF